jgi:hypothetical protein
MSDWATELLHNPVAEIYYRNFRDEQRHPLLVNSAYSAAVEALRARWPDRMRRSRA